MKYFSYPIDTKSLVRKKKKIKEELIASQNNWIEKRVAVLGGSTINEIADQLELALLSNGIRASIYQSEYGRYWEEGVFDNDKLTIFKPDVIYIHTNWRNITEFPSVTDTEEEVTQKLRKEFDRYVVLWETLKKRHRAVLIQNNFERPDYRLMGNRDIWDYRGRNNYISRLNQMIYTYACEHDAFYINDIDYVAQIIGLNEWNNPVYWDMYKSFCPINAIPYLAFSIANIIKSIYGKNKKVLVLDLDNTLWGGVVGDDGVKGIKIGNEMPQGQIYCDFQRYCKELRKIGVVLTVNSKNERLMALEGINHPDGILREEDFVLIKANWNEKDKNIMEISEELSLNPDSFVFVDDNPVERDIVTKHLPMVSVPEMVGVEGFIRVLDQSGFFEVTTLSEDDLNRTETYAARVKSKSIEKAYVDYSEYLADLRMKAIIYGFESIYVKRIAQLTNKTNQFNLTNLRCSEEDIMAMQESSRYTCLIGRLKDRFADYGIVTVLAAEIIERTYHIRLWLMSCRVIKRGLEYFMMNRLMKMASTMGIKRVVGYYYPTERNRMVEALYGSMGFEKCAESIDGCDIWQINTESYQVKTTEIKEEKD